MRNSVDNEFGTYKLGKVILQASQLCISVFRCICSCSPMRVANLVSHSEHDFENLELRSGAFDRGRHIFIVSGVIFGFMNFIGWLF